MHRYFRSLFLIGSLLFLNSAFAQTEKSPSLVWHKTLGGAGNDFGNSALFFDGAYYLCGTTYSADGNVTENHGDADIWVVKLDFNGELLWQKTYGTGLADNGARIIAAPGGGFIVGGTTWPQFAPPTDTNSLQWWIFKIDDTGTMLWEKKYGGSAPDNLTWLDADAQGNIYCAGHSASSNRDFPFNKGNYDIWVYKLTPAGDVIWTRSFGGSDNDRATQVRATKDGGCIVVGFSASSDGDMTENHGGSDGFAAKISASNQVEWKHLFGTPAAEVFNAVDTTYADGYLIAGITHGASDPDGDFDVFSISAGGSIIWNKQFGGSGRDEATAILCRGTSGYQVIGTSESTIDSIPGRKKLKDFLVYRIDTAGNRPDGLFARMFGGSGDEQCGGSLVSSVPPGFLAIGRTNSKDANIPDNHGNFDVWVIKYGGGASGLSASEPFVNFGSVDTGKSADYAVKLTNVGGEVIEIKEVNIFGADSLQFAVKNFAPFSIGLKSDTTITLTFAPYVVGHFTGSFQFVPAVGLGAVVAYHGEGRAGSSVAGLSKNEPLLVSPNPVRDQITVTVSSSSQNLSIQIDNAIGETVKNFKLSELSAQYNLQQLPSGMYMLSVYDGSQVVSRKKFVKE